MTRPWPDWTGQTVVIVATGPTASEVDLSKAKERARFIAVKDGWRLCPWADLLYGCDDHWWMYHRGVPQFSGMKASYGQKAVQQFGAKKVLIDSAHAKLLFGEVGTVGWGGNSGFHALNLAAQFGSTSIILVGFDFRVDKGQHFFGAHAYGKQRPNQKSAEGWRQVLDGEAATLSKRGITVINCSPVSALKAFPKMSFEEALDACREVQSGFRLVPCPGRDGGVQGGDDKTCHHGLCGTCGEAGQGRNRQATAPEEV